MVARFDGDEMNVFLPQSKQTQIELEEIADVKKQIITPAQSVPIIGITQDGLIGAYNLTNPNIRIDWKESMNIMSYTMIDEFEAFKKKPDGYKGSELFSMIIPPRINVQAGKIKIKDGEMVEGQLNKSILAAKKVNSLIHLIWDEYGPDETQRFIDNCQRLVNNFNLWNGFSVGIGDIYVPENIKADVHAMLETKKLEIDHLITEMENNPDLYDADVFEMNINTDTNAILDRKSVV